MVSKFQVLKFLSYKISPTPSVQVSFTSEDKANERGRERERGRQWVTRVGGVKRAYHCWLRRWRKVMNEGMQMVSRTWKRQEKNSPLDPPERCLTMLTLSVAQ